MSHQGRVSKRLLGGGRVVWRFEVDGENPATGKRRRVVRSGFKTKKDAQTALSTFRQEAAAGRTPGRSPRLGGWLANDWLPAIRANVAPSTHRLYSTMASAYVAPHIGGLRLEDVNAATLTSLYATLGERLAPKTVKNVHSLIHRAFRDAVRWGLVGVNPASLADAPKVHRGESPTWDAGQLTRFLESVEGDRLHALWRVLATTGLRRGEVLGLRWTDIQDGHLTVVRSVSEYGGEVFTGDTKTATSRRRVALDPATLQALAAHRTRQLEERLQWGEGYTDNGLVFAREDGTPIRPSWLTRRLPVLAKAAGLPRLTPHGLRHSWATVAMQSGVHPKVVSSRLGHSGVAITLDAYSHVSEGMDKEAADHVAGLIDRRS